MSEGWKFDNLASMTVENRSTKGLIEGEGI